jgi:sterol desaturase/sphingolipid hydroxylase (fatty acid hydroxylase superfamily)
MTGNMPALRVWGVFLKAKPLPEGASPSEPTHFGSGWMSGVLAVVLGAMSFGAVLCLHFPALLTTPELREIYPMHLVRALIQVVLVSAFALGVISIVLRRRKILGLTGLGFAVLAAVLGGSSVAVEGAVPASPYVGLDWFLLNLLLLALVFVPVERLFARWKEQKIFRRGWITDLAYFFANHLLVQVTVLLTLLPAALFFRWAVHPGIQAGVAAQPHWLQFLEILVVADLAEYFIHRLFHAVPALWRFHQIHHSSECLDWLAGSRMHLVDMVVTRGFTFVPLFLLGFSAAPVYAYLVFVSFHAVFIHANVNTDFGPLRWWLVSPRFHHWHHSAQTEALDKNFAVHLPWIDRLFGTDHFPPREWPARYGLAGRPLPHSYFLQFIQPFRKQS